ncbi:MAG: nicotinate phosphoribosyltransferase, partial [Lachnospiraceae bacterium]|nr:nicotinate phosphoribosyltransferase [Lachnospiraceae bacterium]
EMMIQVFSNGQCIYHSPSVMELHDKFQAELDTLWDESKRLTNPHRAHIDLSDKLYQTKQQLLDKAHSLNR